MQAQAVLYVANRATLSFSAHKTKRKKIQAALFVENRGIEN
jgi:hypothetical protein